TEGVEGLASRHAVAVMSLADLERLRRNYRGAQEMAPMVEELAETAFPPGSAENWAFYSFLAELATETGDVETARHHYDAVIRRLEAVPRYGRAHLPFLLQRRAWLENDAGNRDAARRDLERAAALLPFDRGDPHPLAATVASDLVLLGTDATFAEVRRLEEADAVLSRSSAFLPERARIRMARAELLQRRGNARQAIELMESGLADVEVLRRGIAADGLVRAVYQASHADAYGDLARWHHALDEDEAALRAIERGRARSLEESMAERHRVAEGKNPDRLSSLHRRVRAAQSEYSALRRRLRSAHASALHADPQDSALTRLEEQTAAAFEGIQEAREAWRRELYRSPADAKGKGTRLPALSQLREALAPGQALLMYHVGTRHCDAYLVDPLEDRIHHTSLIVSPEDADRLGIRQGPLTRAKLRRLVGPGDPILDST
ncbi:MAG TPA: hypothetical protein VKA74_15155, partial [Myxococcota bacterium]|nr:hypothetical protein [Myxococcota bacterium]